MKYDLHIHSKYSWDGTLEPKRIVEIACKKGLRGVAIVDHNTMRGALETKKYETCDFQVIVGAEIKTEMGEIIGLFLTEEIRVRHLNDVIREIKKQGGLVIVPHPFDNMRHSAYHPIEKDNWIDAIEGFNSRAVFSKYNQRALSFALKNNIPVVAGSDAHWGNEIGNAGIETDLDVREAILSKNLIVYGKRSYLINHVMTKTLKVCRGQR